MTEKEFRKLVTDLELQSAEKNHIAECTLQIEELLNKYCTNNVKIEAVYKGGSLAKGTYIWSEHSLDLIVVVSCRLHKSFMLVNQAVMNEITNALIYGFDDIKKYSDIEINDKNNIITFNYQTAKINLFIRYQFGEDFLKKNDDLQIQFIELANRDYTYFRNTIQIIKHLIKSQNITDINGYLLEILLYYSLNENFSGNHYENYLLAFLKGLEDFISGKKIEVSPDIYQKLAIIKNNSNNKASYTVIDVTSENNIAADITEVKIGEYRKLKKAIAKIVDTKESNLATGLVKLNINPIINHDNSYSWSFVIEGSSFSASGGNYGTSDEEYQTALFKALHKGLKTVIDHNLNKKEVEIVCKDLNILKNEQLLSADNKSRRKNIIAYIELNKIKITNLALGTQKY